MRPGMGIPRADEHVIEAASVTGLPDDLLRARKRIWVVDSPRLARTFASYGPCIVVKDPARLIAYARGIRHSVEVAGDDGREAQRSHTSRSVIAIEHFRF